jgi:hypothetical protein
MLLFIIHNSKNSKQYFFLIVLEYSSTTSTKYSSMAGVCGSGVCIPPYDFFFNLYGILSASFARAFLRYGSN